MSVPGLIIAIILFALGVAGSILPGLPGAPLVWLGMLVYGLFTGFSNLTWTFFLGQALAVGLVFAIDYIAGIWGVRRYGGSNAAVLGSVVGILLGVLLLGPAGIIFGPFIGAVAGELLTKQTLDRAIRTGFGTLLGMVGGTVLKLIVMGGMIFWFFKVI